MSVGDADIGARVVVRSRLAGRGPSGGPQLTDVVGVLERADAESLTVRRRDGSMSRVLVADVVAAKRIPPVAGRGLRIDAEELQRVTDSGWPAPVSEPLGEWLLRAAGGFTGRANSVSVHGRPGCGLHEALQQTIDFYTAHHLPPMAQVVVGSTWERAFTDAGWVTKPGSHAGALVQVAAVGAALSVAEPPERPDAIRLDDRVRDGWLELYNRAGADLDPTLVRAVLEGPEQVVLASSGDPVEAIGRLVVDGAWAGIAAVEVVPQHRGQGLARRIVDALLRAADQGGARWCYLQTMEHNTAALGLYARYGFVTHHRYRYLVPGLAIKTQPSR